MTSRDRALLTNRLAVALSLIGHPAILIPATVALTTARSWSTLAVTAGAVATVLLIVMRRVKAGTYSDHDVSNAEQRRSFYPMAIGVTATTLIASWMLGLASGVVRAFAIATVMLVVGAFATRWLKISLHMMLGAFCTMAVTMVAPRVGIVFCLLLIAVGWSRVTLRRHTIAEVVLGGLLGTVGEWC